MQIISKIFNYTKLIIKKPLFNILFNLIVTLKLWRQEIALFFIVLFLIHIPMIDFNDFSADKVNVSSFTFLISSTLVLFVFLYRERKDINKNTLFTSFQYSMFLTTLTISIFCFILSFFTQLKDILLGIGFIVYFLNLVVSIIYSDSYRLTTLRLIILKGLMEAYTRKFETSLRFIYFVIYIIMEIIVIYSLIMFSVNELIIPIFISLHFIALILYDKLTRNYVSGFLELLNDKVFSANTGISYVNDKIEKKQENKLRHRISLYDTALKDILMINQEERCSMLSKQLVMSDDVTNRLTDLYDNIIITYRDIIIRENIDEDILSATFKNLYSMTPMLNIRTEDTYVKNRARDLSIVYSEKYNKNLIEIFLSFSSNNKPYKAKLYGEYYEKIKTDINVYNHQDNEKTLKQNALKIEFTLLAKYVMDNDLLNVIEICSFMIEKKNIRDSQISEEYLLNLLALLIKSIEIMNFKVAGYLLKLISSNYPSEDISECLINLKKKHFKESAKIPDRYNQKYISENRSTKLHSIDGKVIFLINGASFEYCWNKVVLLCIIYNFEPQNIKVFMKEKLYFRLIGKIKEDLKDLRIDEDIYNEFENKYKREYEINFVIK